MYKTSILALLIITVWLSIIHGTEVSNPIPSRHRRDRDFNDFEDEDLNDVVPSPTRRTPVTRRRSTSRPRPTSVGELEENLDTNIEPTRRTPATRRRGGNVAENTPVTTATPVVITTTANIDTQQIIQQALGRFPGFVNPANIGAPFPINQGGTGGSGNAVVNFGENSHGQVSGGNGGTGGSIKASGQGVTIGGTGGSGSAVVTFGRGSSGTVSGGNGGQGGSVESSGGGFARGGDGGSGSAQVTFQG